VLKLCIDVSLTKIPSLTQSLVRFAVRSKGDTTEGFLGAREVPWLKVWSSEIREPTVRMREELFIQMFRTTTGTTGAKHWYYRPSDLTIRKAPTVIKEVRKNGLSYYRA